MPIREGKTLIEEKCLKLQYDEASTLAKQLFRDSEQLFWALGRIELFQGRFRSACGYFKQCDSRKGQFLLAQCLFHLREYSDASAVVAKYYEMGHDEETLPIFDFNLSVGDWKKLLHQIHDVQLKGDGTAAISSRHDLNNGEGSEGCHNAMNTFAVSGVESRRKRLKGSGGGDGQLKCTPAFAETPAALELIRMAIQQYECGRLEEVFGTVSIFQNILRNFTLFVV
jgi:hypothetical protein